MDNREPAVVLGDSLTLAVQALSDQVPEFLGSQEMLSGDIDRENAHMVFEAFARFLMGELRRGPSGAGRRGFALLNSLIGSGHGARRDLAVVSVLEPLSEAHELRENIEALLEGEARKAFQLLSRSPDGAQ